MRIPNSLLIAGSRDIALARDALWHTFDNLSYVFDMLFRNIIHGGARGVDTEGGEWARGKGYDVYIVRPDWDQHGKAAGFIRNADMVGMCTHAMVVWDGKSKGTKNTLDLLKKENIPHAVRIL